MASRALTGAMSPRDLACWAYATFSYDGIELARTLVGLDNAYEHASYSGVATEDLGAQVPAEARRIVVLP